MVHVHCVLCCNVTKNILLETYAQALSILIHTGIPMVAIISNNFVTTESAISNLKAVPH